MGAFSTLALALVPKLFHKTENRAFEIPFRHNLETQATHALRHADLACHWERGHDGALAAHWVSQDGEIPPCPSPPGLLDGISPILIEDAYHYERHRSVLSLIALSRLSRLNRSRQVEPQFAGTGIFNLVVSDCDADPPE